ncbi:MAG: phage holin family protein [Caldilineaceae bacterium]|nr:phage holin family protein [Caldilineaceae bacterium]
MRGMFIRWFTLTFAIAIALSIMNGHGLSVAGGPMSIFWIAAVYGLVNAFIRPIAKFLSCPLIILTFGLFTLVINALMLMLTAQFSPNFVIAGFWPAFWTSILISIFSSMVNLFVED